MFLCHGLRLEQSSDWPCVPASTFCVRTHPLTTRGRAKFEVKWAAHIRGGCPGRCCGRFRVRSHFHDFWRPFAFMFASVGRRRRGGGCPWRLVVCPARFHSSM